MSTAWAIALGVVLLLVGGAVGVLLARMEDPTANMPTAVGRIESNSDLAQVLDSNDYKPLALAASEYRFGGETYALTHVSALSQGPLLEQSAVLDAAKRFVGSFAGMGFPEEVMIEIHFYANDPNDPKGESLTPSLRTAMGGGWSDSGYGRAGNNINRQWRYTMQPRINPKRAVEWYACAILVRTIEWSAPGGREHAKPRAGQARLGDWYHQVHWCEGNRSTVRPEGDQFPELVMSSFESNPGETR